MASITINLPDEQLQEIQKLSQESQLSPKGLRKVQAFAIKKAALYAAFLNLAA